MSLDQKIDDIFFPAQESIKSKLIPGAALGLITKNGDRAIRVTGYAQLDPETIPLESSMWFDLASLTKVIFTTQNCLELVDKNLFRLMNRSRAISLISGNMI